jgi:hypothetical protein
MFCGFLMTLSACAEEATPTAGSAPAGSATSAPASAAAAEPAAAGGKTDKELCASADKAAKEMTKALVAGLQSSAGDPSPELYKTILTDLEQKVSALAAAGGEGRVTTALKEIAAAAAKAASATDPTEAVADPAFENAGSDLGAACKAVGVTVKF